MSVGRSHNPQDVVVIGSGPIGIFHGWVLAEAGHRVTHLTRPYGGPEDRSFELLDVGTARTARLSFRTVHVEGLEACDLVVVALGEADLPGALAQVRSLPGTPLIVLLGTYPLGLRTVPSDLRGRTVLGHPSITGDLGDGIVRYVRLMVLQSTFSLTDSPAASTLFRALNRQMVTTTTSKAMEAWMAHRALRTTVECKAVLDAGGDLTELAGDRAARLSVARALRPGADALVAGGVEGRPLLDRIRESGLLGELRAASEFTADAADLIYGVRARHMGAELGYLVDWALGLCETSTRDTSALRALLTR